MRASALYIIFVATAVCGQSHAQTSAMTPQQAVETVSKGWLPNPLVEDPTTHKSLSTKGSWGVQQVAPGSTTLADCKDGPVCLRVLYRVAEPATVCTWTLAPPLRPGAEPRVVDLNETAAAMMMRQRFTDDEPGGKAIESPTPSYPPIARAARVEGTVAIFAIVSPRGTVTVQGMTGAQMLQSAAKDAAEHYLFEPTLVNGHPIAVRRNFIVGFR